MFTLYTEGSSLAATDLMPEYATDRWFNGMIDEVCIWNKALSPDEIKLAMEGSLADAAVSREGKLSTTWGQVKN